MLLAPKSSLVTPGNIQNTLTQLSRDVFQELTKYILPYWLHNGRDQIRGGFWGKINQDNQGDITETRSVVMVSRYLWSYAASARFLQDPSLLDSALWAYDYLINHFLDPIYGGMYWSVYSEGTPCVQKKQIYGQAFAIYGLSEFAIALHHFYAAPQNELPACMPDPQTPLGQALDLFFLLEKYASDPMYGGYVEARDCNWDETKDLKLSSKDIDCDKSMNTNLHVLEAFTNLFRALRIFGLSNNTIGDALSSLVQVTEQYILGSDDHLNLYFTMNWTPIGDIISYGHDIEASWLLWEALEELANSNIGLPVVKGSKLSQEQWWQQRILDIARAVLTEGFDHKNGALNNEKAGTHLDETRIWWCQAEALVGFFNAWELSGDIAFLNAVLSEWNWIVNYQADRKGGDWFWAVTPDGTPDIEQPKGGNWKTPYHNSRACMELLRRMRKRSTYDSKL